MARFNAINMISFIVLFIAITCPFQYVAAKCTTADCSVDLFKGDHADSKNVRGLFKSKDEVKCDYSKGKRSMCSWIKDYTSNEDKPDTATVVDDKEPVVKFTLFTKNTIDNPEIFELNKNTTLYKTFEPIKMTKIIVHGWKGSANATFSKTLVKAYLNQFDYNIIVVDWGDKAKTFYPTARGTVPYVARTLAEFVDLLCKTYRMKPEQFHVIGHSLGAHVSGYAGRLITTGKFGRLTALDPALPLFNDDHWDKLNANSADFVDVIHTCGRYLGWYNQTGHADFYPNKGLPVQPGCGMDVIGKCSHRRAWVYFAESISKPNLFMGVPCNSWDNFEKGICKSMTPINMGEYVPTIARGSFYLKTNSEEPFAKGTGLS